MALSGHFVQFDVHRVILVHSEDGQIIIQHMTRIDEILDNHELIKIHRVAAARKLEVQGVVRDGTCHRVLAELVQRPIYFLENEYPVVMDMKFSTFHENELMSIDQINHISVKEGLLKVLDELDAERSVGSYLDVCVIGLDIQHVNFGQI